jgi:hypothetical protein
LVGKVVVYPEAESVEENSGDLVMPHLLHVEYGATSHPRFPLWNEDLD